MRKAFHSLRFRVLYYVMKKIVLLLILFLPVPAHAAPSLVFDNGSLEYDFGQTKEGERLEHTFPFTNTGTDELLIERISAS